MALNLIFFLLLYFPELSWRRENKGYKVTFPVSKIYKILASHCSWELGYRPMKKFEQVCFLAHLMQTLEQAHGLGWKTRRQRHRQLFLHTFWPAFLTVCRYVTFPKGRYALRCLENSLCLPESSSPPQAGSGYVTAIYHVLFMTVDSFATLSLKADPLKPVPLFHLC